MFFSSKKAGLRFEDYVIANIEHLPGYGVASVEQDRKCGTDFFYYGVAVDITLIRKKYTTFAESYIDLPICNVYVGIRTSNGRVRFEHPVLVLFFDLDGMSECGLKFAACELDEAALEQAMDIYWQLVDQEE